MSATLRSRAPVGGCYGIDGAWFDGGQFLPEHLEPMARVSFKLTPEQIQARADRLAQDQAMSKHVGTVGGKLEVNLQVAVVLTFDGFYGPSYMTIARDELGNVFMSRTSKMWAKRGDQVHIKASVKEHSEYNGVKQTVIQRVKAA